MTDATHRNPLTVYQRGLQNILTRLRPAILASLVKRMLGVERTVVDTPNGRFWIDPVSNLGTALSRHGSYESGMLKVLETFLCPGSTFVDLGANEGYFTVIGAKLCGASGRVVAVEPQERLLPVIAENLRLNGVNWANVLNVAVTDTPGVATIQLTPDTNNGASGLHRATKYRLPTQPVATRTLAQVLNDEGLARVDLMKVDIEGFEYEALLGSPEVFAQHRVRALALELHPTILTKRNKDVADINKMLADNSYNITDRFANTVWLLAK
jgi:FkbM family methyltransferase